MTPRIRPPLPRGEAVRDFHRSRRAMRLQAAYQRTGDRRKLKRARRLRAQNWRSMMRRLSAALDGVTKAFSDAAQAIGRIKINPVHFPTIVAPPRNPR